jgi:hypothetical protein
VSDLSRQDEILLREYQQAGEACRGHDTLIRTGLTIFGAAQVAILGFIATQTQPAPLPALAPLEFLGFWLSLVALATTWRLHHRYKNYMERSHVLERRLGMYLYRYSEEYFRSKWYLAWLPGNKMWWGSVPFVTLLIFAALLFRDGPAFVTGLVCAIGGP